MYERFFGFSQRPFALLPDSGSIFWTEGHRNAFSVLEVGLDRLSQITVLTGGIGTGKTTLIRHLLQTISTGFSVGLLSNFAGERGDLLRWVLSAFGLNIAGTSEAIMFRRLETFFGSELDAGRRSVLVVDEAQNLSEKDLESLRLLGNLNTDQVLMMLVLVGQPQLRAKMARSENQRLCQRIGADYHLEPLSRDETARYVRHRCVRAGGAPDVFDPAALDEIFRISNGVPRKINVLCDLALVTAFADGVRAVDYGTVRSVMDDARRHGTYMSLTEHDHVVVDTQLAVGAEDQLVTPAAAAAASRDPMQRLTLVLESGGGGLMGTMCGRSGQSAPAPAAAPDRSASAAGADRPDPNALLDISWSDDTLLFVDDPADEEIDPDRSARGPGDGRPNTAEAVPSAQAEPPSQPAKSGRDRPSQRAARAARGAARGAARAEGQRTAGARAEAPVGARAAGARTGTGTELDLRRAFAPPAGWRTVSWRGAAVAACAIGGSLAAGVVLALLPDGAPPADAESAVGGVPGATWQVPSTTLAEGEPPANPEVVARAQAAAGTRAQAASVGAIGTAAFAEPTAAQRVPADDVWARFSPVAPSGGGFEPEQPTATLAGSVGSERPAPARANVTLADAGVVAGGGTALSLLGAGSERSIRIERPPLLGAWHAMEALPPDAAAPGDGGHQLGGSAPASGVRAAREAQARPGMPVPHDRPDRLALSGLIRPASASAQAAAVPPARAPENAVTADAGPQALFRAALDVAVDDARAAVIGYARATLMGHERAAYYLGQIYETGDGVPVDFAIARHWYEAASHGNARARQRLAELPRPERGMAVAPPITLLAQPVSDGEADFVWTSGEGADPASYVIEIGTARGGGAVAAHAVTGSAARLPLAEGASHWRVLALDGAGGRGAASDWRALSADGPDRSAAADGVEGQL